MPEKQKISLKEKEEKLRKKIEEAKSALSRLQEKRQIELGKLACKHGLDSIDNTVLDKHFAELAKVLLDGNA